MRVLVPFDATDPKTRLHGTLTDAERHEFARVMLRDVLDALRRAGAEPEVIATESVAVEAPVAVDDRPLTAAVNARLGEGPVAVVMADLALATPRALARLLDADADVALVPGRGGGTAAFLSRHPEFRVDYHGTSYVDHLRRAHAVGATVREVDSVRLGTDVDERDDLVEVLLHAEGAAPEWLRDAGFTLDVTEGRVGLRREP